MASQGGDVGGVSDLDRQIEALKRCEYLKESEVKALCAKARELLVDESNVQRVDAPVTVRARPRRAASAMLAPCCTRRAAARRARRRPRRSARARPHFPACARRSAATSTASFTT